MLTTLKKLAYISAALQASASAPTETCSVDGCVGEPVGEVTSMMQLERQDGRSTDFEEKLEQKIAQRLEATFEARLGSLELHMTRLQKALGDGGQMKQANSLAPAIGEDGSRVPSALSSEGKFVPLSMTQRLRHLERKVDGGLNWLKNPQLWMNLDYTCNNETDLGTDHHVCFEGWAERQAKRNGPCIVYDLGIRENPEFGEVMMKEYGCSVRAYDPSPITQKWWTGESELDAAATAQLKSLKDAGSDKYNLSFYGAAGQDGPLQLFEYNWGQVSIYRAENDVSSESGKAKGQGDVAPKQYLLEAKTLGTMMKDHGDSYVDVVKVDIEGSEFAFMQDIFDRMGCPPIGQITLEYHHFSLDDRYGSSPELNSIHNMLNACGFKSFLVRDHWRNDADFPGPPGSRKIPPMRYTLASYCKDC